MTVTASDLRQNIYKLLDKVAETGESIEIKRKGKIIKIVAEQKQEKLKRLKKRKVFSCEPDELIHMDWSGEWKI